MPDQEFENQPLAEVVDREAVNQATALAIGEVEKMKREMLAAYEQEIAQKRVAAEAQAWADARLKVQEWHDKELAALTTRLSEKEVTSQRELEVLAESERERIATLRREWETQRSLLQSSLDQREKDLFDKEVAANTRRLELDSHYQMLEEEREQLRQAKDAFKVRGRESEKQIQERIADIENQVQARLEAELARDLAIRAAEKLAYQQVLEQAESQEKELRSYKELKRQLGADPLAVLREIRAENDRQSELLERNLREPVAAHRKLIDDLRADNERLKRELELAAKTEKENADRVAVSHHWEREYELMKSKKETAESIAADLRLQVETAEASLNRFQNAFGTREDRVGRISQIKRPRYKVEELPKLPENWPPADYNSHPADEIDELIWLDNIEKKCQEFGVEFHPRILRAFHTALKSEDWSPITILAGVSGTGKSLLPKLYSHFGGLVYDSIPVQPNWDSKESMLGYYNSIDNYFDAQPALHLLAQSQEKYTKADEAKVVAGYPGLRGRMCLMLLDEMNLAHPELYFAEFLSKLEERRDSDRTPKLEVSIGSGLEPYRIPLGRNLLWTGTMNQDETTKSLSDKVLDRSTIIFFPRPSKLVSRPKRKALSEVSATDSLSYQTWRSWRPTNTQFIEVAIKPYKDFIEATNFQLARTGRALGHRVWQSIEYYLANYPGVRQAASSPANSPTNQNNFTELLHNAFEDQLVQKVMPKLRGIDTNSASGKSALDGIAELLQTPIKTGDGEKTFNLIADFKNARSMGYGQFDWQTAEYLEHEENN